MSTSEVMQQVTAVILFAAGYAVHGWLHTCPEPELKTTVEYQDQVQTEIAYVPKEVVTHKDAEGNTTTAIETTDINIKLDKPELAVKVNGKDFVFEKTDDEKFIFDKNKLQLMQSSYADLNITVPTIDETKYWELGIGYSKDGAVGQIGFPIKKHVGGWVVGRSDNVMAGINFKF